jgi:hypothetical protein
MGVLVMKYARAVDHSASGDGSDIRMLDAVAIPDAIPSWAPDVPTYLSLILPALSGFEPVPDFLVHGAEKKSDHTFINPGEAEPDAD